ncbi:tRNA uridine-5-carboxymethylaminomethyl(34) synthesis GTPase MnmE [Burkholderia pseudomallei]|uniref:tRNA uridine-5-carboxymethylaminomethyl(34) synthesis GTPase MnmE n=1 Tax=Burkholderia pseudomallei TaxID=28450 RepID=UPI0005154506|nr:tRNA uridine-5-carboxymethylaminomethyl(34) synthesis GTPase MnmE [Burkholderia pseudomallei]AIS88728.1 tRNA modification GTPase TrmE [Burkholderia pseudomallei NAU35A-3]MBM5693402.1 tRNA uridine-5-carboxymethylaminomethyl(34) synthesis GTPase MnmE [Burkholderia pseudomallei]OMS84555.1 tRNA uridine(34) 5-carboxymethylaminomethyl synthesis GTPase MnmE [Burkholderia pseudomallei]OMV03035.1 tRNA uridine(34) 5-carboxymethylaminomethyl synthesis GTPase MnmE [Burkholderia pseudomallei]OMV07049.1 
MLATDSDPIVAIATASGRGGIGVVRLSLGRAGEAAARALSDALCGARLMPRHASYVPFLDGAGEPLDRGIALYFPAPHSYTGEHVIELQGHGGPIVLQLLLQRCLDAGRAHGLRLAEPGEFTRRAFLNDKLDLAQAEAVADLIEASTEAAARSAGRSLDGAFSRDIHALVDDVIALRMLVEATLDFPEEEIDFLEAADARGKLAHIRERLAHVLGDARQGALLREGLSVVLAGQPNVGKSSLLNALAGAELAIVTPIAGTTRDKVAQTIQIEGIPLHIIDTAGLRETEDEVEKIGIARTWGEIERADVVLHLLDARSGLGPGDEAIAARFPGGVPVVRVLNKTDLTGAPASVTRTGGGAARADVCEVRLSAKRGDGIDLLRGELLRIAGWQAGAESVYLARERHLIALRAAQAHLARAAEHAEQNAQALDLFAEELRLAQERLNSITGEFTSDDLLGVIFSRFCIGK